MEQEERLCDEMEAVREFTCLGASVPMQMKNVWLL